MREPSGTIGQLPAPHLWAQPHRAWLQLPAQLGDLDSSCRSTLPLPCCPWPQMPSAPPQLPDVLDPHR